MLDISFFWHEIQSVPCQMTKAVIESFCRGMKTWPWGQISPSCHTIGREEEERDINENNVVIPSKFMGTSSFLDATTVPLWLYKQFLFSPSFFQDVFVDPSLLCS